MRRKLLPMIATALVAVVVAVPGIANSAHAGLSDAGLADAGLSDAGPAYPNPVYASSAQPPPGYVPPAGYRTTPPESCYVYVFTTNGAIAGAMTECTRIGGLHRAVAQCANGHTIYGWTEEMEYFRQSLAMCRSKGYYGDLTPALYVWGEYYLDW